MKLVIISLNQVSRNAESAKSERHIQGLYLFILILCNRYLHIVTSFDNCKVTYFWRIIMIQYVPSLGGIYSKQGNIFGGHTPTWGRTSWDLYFLTKGCLGKRKIMVVNLRLAHIFKIMFYGCIFYGLIVKGFRYWYLFYQRKKIIDRIICLMEDI